MATGYGDTYRAIVIDDADPLMEHRLRVRVPDVYDEESAWARPSVPPGDVILPSVGDEVLVEFEAGDSDHPVWMPIGELAPTEPARHAGYIGLYRATVIDTMDPMDTGRLQVLVPEVLGDVPAWASRSSQLDGSDLPNIGDEVWVEFEAGDPQYPVWVGVS